MSFSYMCGFEVGSLTEIPLNAGGLNTTTNPPTIQSSVTHGSKYAMRCNPTADSRWVRFSQYRGGDQSGNPQPPGIFCSVRWYMYIAELPNAQTMIYTGGKGIFTEYQTLFLNTDGSLTVWDGAGTPIQSTKTLTTNSWHQISLAVNPIDGSNSIVLYVDGVQWISFVSTPGNTISYDRVFIGVGLSGSVSCDVYFDDIIWDDGSTGAVNAGPGNQVILLPVSDISVGEWTAGAGATIDLYKAVSNIPPIGQLPGRGGTETNTSQIKNDSTVVPSDYIVSVESYLAAGIPSTSAVNAVVAVTNDTLDFGANIFGAVWISSNPVQSAPPVADEFDFSVGFSQVWGTDQGIVASNPSVDLATLPTVTLRKVTSASTPPEKHGGGNEPIDVDVDFLGIYVDFNTQGN